MKKIIMAFVFFMTIALNINGQDFKDVKYHKIKEVAVKAFKSKLIAPSKFILANSNGDELTIDDLYFKVEEEKIEGKKFYPKCWAVLVQGDAMNGMGGYKHTMDIVYVYGTEDYPYVNYPYYLRKYEIK